MQEQPAADSSLESASQAFVVQWNNLISTTNWDKGRIICAWRESLIAEGAPATDYSDEAWARRIGTVSSQHVGRLRRVYSRFGDVQRDYAGLYWSHFQAALDWNDAEMWLEGAVQNEWSVSETRHARWEALGAPAELKPREEDIIVADLDEDVRPGDDSSAGDEPLTATTGDVRDPAATNEDLGELQEGVALSVVAKDESTTADDVPPFRPFEHLPPLPDDLAEAIDAVKVVLLNHKLSDWEKVARDDVVAHLDALRELALAPSEA